MRVVQITFVQSACVMFISSRATELAVEVNRTVNASMLTGTRLIWLIVSPALLRTISDWVSFKESS
jgi:hypothetical protein